MPIKRVGMCNVPWWSLEISCMRKRLNAARRRFQRTSANDIRELHKRKYLDLRKNCNHMLVDAKNESGKKFLSGIKNFDLWKKLYTYGVKENFMKRIEVTGLQLQSGNCISSLEETIDAILDKAFLPIVIGLMMPFMFNGVFQLVVNILHMLILPFRRPRLMKLFLN